eukprot:PLAT11931.1.p2 GENE.PLAT11931.1~~PLAT11931.1.p2  ORF type:complete len:256 (-),score=123.59 PLAT11931.1:25-792(-)
MAERKRRGHKKPHLNRLLIKDTVGKSRRSGLDLPEDEEYVFGAKVEADAEGVREVLSWKSSTLSTARPGDKSFLRMNKLAAKRGVSTARDVKEFRKRHVIRKEVPTLLGRREARRRNDSSTFGYRTRPSTPIDELLQNKYNEAAGKEEVDYPDLSGMRKKLKPPQVRATKASLGKDVRTKGLSEELLPTADRPPFKMRKFAKVKSRLATTGAMGGRPRGRLRAAGAAAAAAPAAEAAPETDAVMAGDAVDGALEL